MTKTGPHKNIRQKLLEKSKFGKFSKISMIMCGSFSVLKEGDSGKWVHLLFNYNQKRNCLNANNSTQDGVF